MQSNGDSDRVVAREGRDVKDVKLDVVGYRGIGSNTWVFVLSMKE